MTLAALRQAFNERFPNLSLSFFTKPQSVFQSSPVKYMITDLDLTLDQIQKQAHQNEIIIDDQTTVEGFEQSLEREFGLHVQVMRKDGADWEHTPPADQLTLSEQNELAEKRNGAPDRRNLLHEYTDARTEWYLG